MKRLSKEQRFLYGRIAILLATLGWLAFAFAGLKGFPFWYGGFVLCFWLGAGLSNYPQKSSVWLAVNKRGLFLLLFAAFAGAAFLFDQFGLKGGLWFHPAYEGAGLVWIYGVLYPFGGLACLELLYVISDFFGERLQFVHHAGTISHHIVDILESLLFLLMAGVALYGVAGGAIYASALLFISFAWLIAAAVKLAFHTRHARQYLRIIVVSFLVAALLHGIPATGAFEWIYLDAPLLNRSFIALPLWVWLGYSWLLLFTLRLWIYLVLHPKIN